MASNDIKTRFKNNIPEIIVPTLFGVAAGVCALEETQPLMQVVMGTVSALYGLCAADAVTSIFKSYGNEGYQGNRPVPQI